MPSGHSYVFKLEWKTNGNAPGATIYAGAGSAPKFSPTSLMAQIFPAAPSFMVSTTQYKLAGSDGVTWQPVDLAHLRATVTPSAGSTAVLGANADLWTANAGYNQDLGIFVSDNGGLDTLVAWKESGGSAGTFSPNAAYVKAVYPMAATHTYVFTLKWKTNHYAPSATIYAAAGGAAPHSPTSLFVESIAAGANPYSATSTGQYSLWSSYGVTWQPMDTVLDITVTAGAPENSSLGASTDLWTANSGYNQDIGIFVSDTAGADTLLPWKDSGGLAGTYSPNAAFVQAMYPMISGHTYVFKLKWKTNQNPPGAKIYAGAGSGPVFSPPRMVVEVAP